jgi:hypothetical protein
MNAWNTMLYALARDLPNGLKRAQAGTRPNP